MKLTQNICNPERKKYITAQEFCDNINNYYSDKLEKNQKVAILKKENDIDHIYIDSTVLCYLQNSDVNSKIKIII